MTQTADELATAAQRRARAARARYGVVLGLLLITFVYMAASPKGSWVPPLTAALEGLTFLAALRAASAGRRSRQAAIGFVVAAALVTFVVALVTDSSGLAIGLVFSATFVILSPIVIVRGLIHRRTVDVQTVLGALTVYGFMGMAWAFVFATIDAVGGNPFFAQITSARLADFLYFSFVTLTTVGYGDLTAIGGLGRALAALEALTGQMYMVTVVAVIVANLRRPARRTGDGEPGSTV